MDTGHGQEGPPAPGSTSASLLHQPHTTASFWHFVKFFYEILKLCPTLVDQQTTEETNQYLWEEGKEEGGEGPHSLGSGAEASVGTGAGSLHRPPGSQHTLTRLPTAANEPLPRSPWRGVAWRGQAHQ